MTAKKMIKTMIDCPLCKREKSATEEYYRCWHHDTKCSSCGFVSAGPMLGAPPTREPEPLARMNTSKRAPNHGQRVIVAGGMAEYRNGIFYSGMVEPQWQRPIEWNVNFWWPLPEFLENE